MQTEPDLIENSVESSIDTIIDGLLSAPQLKINSDIAKKEFDKYQSLNIWDKYLWVKKFCNAETIEDKLKNLSFVSIFIHNDLVGNYSYSGKKAILKNIWFDFKSSKDELKRVFANYKKSKMFFDKFDMMNINELSKVDFTKAQVDILNKFNGSNIQWDESKFQENEDFISAIMDKNDIPQEEINKFANNFLSLVESKSLLARISNVYSYIARDNLVFLLNVLSIFGSAILCVILIDFLNIESSFAFLFFCFPSMFFIFMQDVLIYKTVKPIYNLLGLNDTVKSKDSLVNMLSVVALLQKNSLLSDETMIRKDGRLDAVIASATNDFSISFKEFHRLIESIEHHKLLEDRKKSREIEMRMKSVSVEIKNKLNNTASGDLLDAVQAEDVISNYKQGLFFDK